MRQPCSITVTTVSATPTALLLLLTTGNFGPLRTAAALMATTETTDHIPCDDIHDEYELISITIVIVLLSRQRLVLALLLLLLQKL